MRKHRTPNRVQNLLVGLSIVAAVIDIAKLRAGRAAGYRPDINPQPTCSQRFFHAAIRPDRFA